MRVATDLHVEWVDDEAVLLDGSNKQLHYLNETAAFVFALIEEYGYEIALEKLYGEQVRDEQQREELEELIQSMVQKGILIGD